MTTHELLSSRWSPSVFDPAHELDRAELELLLTAARWAPSAGNTQPWSFLVTVRGDEGHRILVRALSDGNRDWVPHASAVLIALAHVDGPQGRYAEYATGQAVAHLTIQAGAMGLHTHQFAGFDHELVAAEFAVPDGIRVIAGIAVGRHGDPERATASVREREARPRSRRALTETAYGGAWGRPW